MNPIETILSHINNHEQQMRLLATQLGQLERQIESTLQQIEELRTIQANLRNE